MRNRSPLLASLLCAASLMLATSAAGGPMGAHRSNGLLPLRNQFPLHLPFLALPAENAGMLSLHQLKFAITYNHANTFVKSGTVVHQIEPQRGRKALTQADIEQLIARRPDKDSFYLDTASRRTALQATYGVTANLDLMLEVPFIHYSGGFLDHTIERFHNEFGLPDDKRPAFVRNNSEVFLYLSGQSLFLEPQTLKRLGLGDIVLSAKARILRERRLRPALAVRAAVKLPTGSHRTLFGSGSADFGMMFAASKAIKRNYLHMNAGAMLPGKWRALPALTLAPAYTLVFGYERLIGAGTSLLVQHASTTSIFRRATRASIAKTSYEISAGVKFLTRSKARWSFAITENHTFFNNTPDIGFQVAMERLLL